MRFLKRLARKLLLWVQSLLMRNPYEPLDQVIEQLGVRLSAGRIILTVLCEQMHLTDDRAMQCRARFVRRVEDPCLMQEKFKLEEKLFFRQLSQIATLEGSLDTLRNLIDKLKRRRKMLRRFYILRHGICTGVEGEAFRELGIDPDEIFAQVMENLPEWDKKCNTLYDLFEESKWIAFLFYPKKPPGVRNPRLPRQDNDDIRHRGLRIYPPPPRGNSATLTG
ncbi:MAG: hypothetical protein AAF471_00340 [Myxococcota bacterium]